MDYPHINLTAAIDVSLVRRHARANGLSFFKTFLYLVTLAANRIPELRQRIRGETVVEHDHIHPSYTLLTEDEVFGFTHVEWQSSAAEFFAAAEAAEARVREEVTLKDEPGRDDYLFTSSIPWVHFSSVSHPIQMNPVDSIPRLIWGRAVVEGSRHLMPLSIQAHHALVDGLHIGRFFEAVADLLLEPQSHL